MLSTVHRKGPSILNLLEEILDQLVGIIRGVEALILLRYLSGSDHSLVR
jgi:hypothetical protein